MVCSQVMEEVLRDIAGVAQSIALVEADVIATEAAIKEAKAAGDAEELAAQRAKVNALRDEKNKLRDKENKLRDEKNALLRTQGTRAAALLATCALLRQRVASRTPNAARTAVHRACRLQSAAGERRYDA